MREVPQAIRHVTVRACLRTCHYTYAMKRQRRDLSSVAQEEHNL
jgi:hypothetical protein